MTQTNARKRRILPRVILLLIAAVVGGSVVVQSQDTTADTGTTSGAAVTISESRTVETGTLTITLDAAGSLTPAANETLMFSASAPVTEVLVQVGDQVRAGDVLARLDTTDAEAQIRVAELQLEQAQLSLDSVLAPPTDLEISLAEANVALAQAQAYTASSSGSTSEIDAEIARLQVEMARNSLWQAQINRDQRVEQDAARGETTWVEQQQFDQSVNSAEDSVYLAELSYQDALEGDTSSGSSSAYASILNAQASLDSLMAGASDSEIRQAEIRLEEAQMNLDTRRAMLDNYVLVAPFDGIIVEQNLLVGINPPAAGAMTLLDPTRYTIDLSIAEADVVNVSEGQAVTIEVQTFPDAAITGSIAYIDTIATLSSQLVTYTAQVALDETDVMLRPGMSATATVILQRLDNVLLIPNRFISTDTTTGGNIVTVETEPGVYTSVPVTIGERSTNESQILSGLQAGQTIVIIAREVEASTTGERNALGGLLGGGMAGGGGEPPAGFQPPSGGMPSGGGGGAPGGG